MKTEANVTMGYTEADVEQWDDAVRALVQAWAPNSDTRQRVEPILALLKAAALEGTKVPGLVADNAALVSLLKRVSDAGFKLFGVLVADVEAVAAQPSQGAALLAEFEDVRAAWHRETERADALQARVKELEDEHHGHIRKTAEHVRSLESQVAVLEEALSETESERNEHEEEAIALRAQVETMRAALEQVVRWDGFTRVPDHDDPTKDCSYGYAYGSNGERDFMRHVASVALSAPTATAREEWSAAEPPSARPTCPRCGERPCTPEHIFCRKCVDEVIR